MYTIIMSCNTRVNPSVLGLPTEYVEYVHDNYVVILELSRLSLAFPQNMWIMYTIIMSCNTRVKPSVLGLPTEYVEYVHDNYVM